MLSRIRIGCTAIAALTLTSTASAEVLDEALDFVAVQMARQVTESISEQIAHRRADANDEQARSTRVWAGLSYQDLTTGSERLLPNSPDFEAQMTIAQLGVGQAVQINEQQQVVAGLSVGFSQTDAAGGVPLPAPVHFDATFWTFAGYFAWIPNEHFSATLSGGYLDVSGIDGVGTTGSMSNGGFLELDFEGAETIGIIEASARAGYRLQKGGAHTVILGADVGPRLGIAKPFVRARYEARLNRDLFPFDDSQNSVLVGGGVSIDLSESIALEARGWTELGISDLENHQGTINVTAKF